MSHEEHSYHPQDAIGPTLKYTGMGLFAGALLSGTQNALQKRNVGAMGIFTKFGATTAIFGTVAGTFTFVRIASANLRQKNDSYNDAIGGFLGGAVLGIARRSFSATAGYGALFSVVMATFTYTGGLMPSGLYGDDDDRVEAKERYRKNRRRPIEETIAELGEGRGIFGPGYEERRRERIKANYGIEIQ